MGLIAIVINVLGDPELGIKLIPPGVLAFGPKMAPALSTSNLFAVLMFALAGVLALLLRAEEARLGLAVMKPGVVRGRREHAGPHLHRPPVFR